MRNESGCCKKKGIAAEDVLLLSLRQMLGLIGVCLRPVLYPSDGELLDKGMHVGVNVTTCRHSERKEGVGSEERAPILVFLPLDCVDEVFSYMACCIPQIGAGTRVDDGNVE